MPKRFRPPKVTSPPTPYEVTWLDAAHESDFDGLSAQAGGLAKLPYLGYHIGTRKDNGRDIIVLSSEHDKDSLGRTTSRFHMTIPVAWIVKMTPLKAPVEAAPEGPNA